LLSENNSEGDSLGSKDLKFPEDERYPEITWRHAVEHYSPLRLTYEKDRLPAISACVKRMQRLRQDDVYIAGMWKKTLLYDLCWFSIDNYEPLPRPDRSGIVAPSWSWISTSSGTGFVTEIRPLLSPDDIDVVYNITGPTHIGQVSHADLHLRAKFMFAKRDFTAVSPIDTFEHPYGIWENERPPMMCSGGGWDFDHTTADPPIHENETFITLLLSFTPEPFGIVLRELANKKFERVGYTLVYLPESDTKQGLAWLMGLPIGEFTIV
jgi:hypothetical protein